MFLNENRGFLLSMPAIFVFIVAFSLFGGGSGSLFAGEEKPKVAVPGSWAAGILYPGGSVKYIHENHAWELKAQGGSGVIAAGPRYYRYITSSGLRLFWGVEADFISFKGAASKGSGFAGGCFAGGEIPLGDKIGLAMDFGPMYINVAETKYSQSASGVEYILNMAIYWHFR